MTLLTEGMMTITESTSRFAGKLPILYGAMGLVFLYARKPRKKAAQAFQGTSLSPAAQLQRSHARLQIDR